MAKKPIATITKIAVGFADGTVDEYGVSVPCYASTNNLTELIFNEAVRIDPNIVTLRGFWTDFGRPGLKVQK